MLLLLSVLSFHWALRGVRQPRFQPSFATMLQSYDFFLNYASFWAIIFQKKIVGFSLFHFFTLDISIFRIYLAKILIIIYYYNNI